VQRGEDGPNEAGQDPRACRVELRRDEVEEHAFRARGVAENRVDGGDGAAEIAGVEGHGDVDQRRVARGDSGVGRGNGAARPISVPRCLGVVEEGAVVFGGRKRADSEAEERGKEEAENERRNDGSEAKGKHWSNGSVAKRVLDGRKRKGVKEKTALLEFLGMFLSSAFFFLSFSVGAF
ncbi:hypothetical protein V8G54_017311, partial [Vigna mungo]